MACAERAIEYAVEKLGQLLIDEIIFLNEVRADVCWMQSELRWMMGFLEDGDAKGKNGDKRTEIWIREVTNVAIEAEDVVDTFMLQIEAKNSQKMGFFFRSSDTATVDETSVSNDEPILSPQDDVTILSPEDESGETTVTFRSGRTRQTVIQKKEAPLGAISYKVMLQVMGIDPNKDRPGVDIVALIGGGLNGIERMKSAIKFLIKKLNPIDRLSIISFSGAWQQLCPLRQLAENSVVEIEKLVDALSIGENVDMNEGLKMGLQLLNDRRFTTGRKAAIFLMVDRNACRDTNATCPSMNVPVHAFTFGMQCSQALVRKISEGSMGGVFSHIRHSDIFSVAFSHCLAKLLTVALPDLKLTVRQIESAIKSVNAGKYPQSTELDGSVTVGFGDIFVNQLCKVLVDLHLPAVRRPRKEDVVQFTFSYSADKIELAPLISTILRSETCGWD